MYFRYSPNGNGRVSNLGGVMPERTKCPCCGKKIFTLKLEKEAVHQMIYILLQDPNSLHDWIVGMFDLLHNPEQGEPFIEEE